jgi:hypothetical protein
LLAKLADGGAQRIDKELNWFNKTREPQTQEACRRSKCLFFWPDFSRMYPKAPLMCSLGDTTRIAAELSTNQQRRSENVHEKPNLQAPQNGLVFA